MCARLFFSLTLLALSALGARAQDSTGCDKFKWSIARERGWFATGAKPVAAGGEVTLDQGFEVALAPVDSLHFVAPPERASKAGTFGGVLEIAIPKAGAYDVTLSAEAWVDVVQNGAIVKSADFSGQKNCPGVRKSVRFNLAAGDAKLQISNAEAAKIDVAPAAAE
jgi:hypothetical protein